MTDILRSIEPFQLNQGFGENPSLYAKFGLKGHNGWDLKTKFTNEYRDDARKLIIKATPQGKRPILASCYIKHYRTSSDPGGYGDFFEGVTQLYSTWKLTFAHCSLIRKWLEANEGDELAISGTTGNSTGDHLHLTVKQIRIVNGVHENLNYNNGYFGAVNPQLFFDELRRWLKEKGEVPTVTVKENPMATLQVEKEVYEKLVGNSTSYDAVTDFFGLSRNASKDQTIQKINELKKRGDDKEADIKKVREEEEAKADQRVKTGMDKVLEDMVAATNSVLQTNFRAFPDILDHLKTLKDQQNTGNDQHGTGIEEVLEQAGYQVDSLTIKKK